MKKRKKPFSIADTSFNTVNFLIMTAVAVATIYPFWYVLVASLSSMNHVYTSRFLIWPDGISLVAYRHVLSNARVPRAFLNTGFIVVAGTAISMVLTTMGAYVLSKPYLPGRNALTGFIIITMLFNGGLIPFYMTVKYLGLLDSIWALIFPVAISSYNMIIMRNFLQGLPSALEESAHIDGASHFQVLLSIYLPLSSPVLATITLFYAVSYWNSFFHATIFINKQELQPIQVLLREVLLLSRTDMLISEDYRLNSPTEIVKMALVIVTIVPIIVVYPFLQKYFVKGVLIGSLKG